MSNREFLQSLETLGIKLGLDQIRRLMAELGHPDRSYQSVIVAGTNGKGSVTAMVERGLRAAGVTTGRYTSPHLISLNERFAVNDVDIDDAAFDTLADAVRRAASTLPDPPSFFEATTALGLEWFRRAHVEIAVLEVGLGGRLDATNVVTPAVAAITSVDLDHEEMLGGTLRAIAAEKAGVIKAGSVVVLGENVPEVRAVVAAACAGAGARLVDAAAVRIQPAGVTADGRARAAFETPVRAYPVMTLGLRGRHQIANSVTAIRVLEELDAIGCAQVRADAVRTAVEEVTWPARLQLISWRGRDVLVDGAHNPSGAIALADFVETTYGRRLPFVVGIMADKQIDAMLRALARAASRFVFTAAASRRAAAPDLLRARATEVAPDVPVSVVPAPGDAVAAAAGDDGPVVVAGSLYLAGEILANLT